MARRRLNNMATPSFEFEWIDPGEAHGAELRATWAQLRLLIDQNQLTRLIDGTSRSVRSHVFLPLYPLAEWITTNRWSLLYEVESPRRSELNDYSRRHSLRHAGEGFALPALSIIPGGELVALKWSSTLLPMQQLEFTEDGIAFVSVEDFRGAMTLFIDAVIRRLEEAGISGTLLQEEWAAISAAGKDEIEFCASAAALGLEPYAVKEEQQRCILDAAQRVDPGLRREFFAIADVAKLPEQTRYLAQVLGRAKANTSDLHSLQALQSLHLGQGIGPSQPWDEGYEFARLLRSHLNLDGRELPDFAALAKALGTRDEDLRRAISEIDGRMLFDAAVDVNPNRSPGFAVAGKRESSTRFALCRALYEYLSHRVLGPSLITGAHSDRQKRNRAFAAEFLAPASGLAKAIGSNLVGAEEIDELAERFGVSPLVIEHQVSNHHLARIYRDWPETRGAGPS